MIKIISIIGARPQFVKIAPFVWHLRENNGYIGTESVQHLIVHSGQHYHDQLSKVFFDQLELPEPKYNLGIGSFSHGKQTGRILEEAEAVFSIENPDAVMVFGDTNSTLAGCLAAVKMDIPVAHIEAGLRSYNRQMPEEINRVLTDHASDYLYAPTAAAVANLEKEGIGGEAVEMVGDIMYEAAILFGARADGASTILDRLGLTPRQYILATIHRPVNTDDAIQLEAIISQLSTISGRYMVVFPVHPRTSDAIARKKIPLPHNESFYTIGPVGYLDMVQLERNAKMIITDSGGVQKEAFFHKVPCITLRSETEWVELVEMKWNHLANVDNLCTVFDSFEAFFDADPPRWFSPYGDGKTSKYIMNHLVARVGARG